MDLGALQPIYELITTWGLKLVGGIAVLIGGLLVARVARRTTAMLLGKANLNESLVNILAGLAYYALLAVIVIAVFGVVGIETASLITILGASSLAIGLALQGSLSNFAAGIMLHIFHPYREGDYIEVGDYAGTVDSLGTFSTVLCTLDNKQVVIPNRYISDHPIRNWSSNETLRIELDMEVAIGSDFEVVRKAIEQELKSDSRILAEPAPLVAIKDFGDTSAWLAVYPWCKHADYWALRFSLPERLKSVIEQNGGAMPTPQRDLRMLNEGKA
jgi:small conductance mechanosensitive channel